MPDRREHLAGQCFTGELARPLPQSAGRRPAQRTIAGEAELATGGSLRPLVDHAADRRRIGWMAHPIEDDLRHRPLSIDRFAGGLVIDRLAEALDRPGTAVGIGLRVERRGGTVSPCRWRALGVFDLRFFRGQWPIKIGRWQRHRNPADRWGSLRRQLDPAGHVPGASAKGNACRQNHDDQQGDADKRRPRQAPDRLTGQSDEPHALRPRHAIRKIAGPSTR